MVHQAQRKGACHFRLHPSKLAMMMMMIMQETENLQQQLQDLKRQRSLQTTCGTTSTAIFEGIEEKGHY